MVPLALSCLRLNFYRKISLQGDTLSESSLSDIAFVLGQCK